jgi:hypothetical protein
LNNALLAPAKQSVTTGGRKNFKKEKKGKKATQKPMTTTQWHFPSQIKRYNKPQDGPLTMRRGEPQDTLQQQFKPAYTNINSPAYTCFVRD